MYSPKICEELIPLIYQLKQKMKIPMTRIVNKVILDYIVLNLPDDKTEKETAQATIRKVYGRLGIKNLTQRR